MYVSQIIMLYTYIVLGVSDINILIRLEEKWQCVTSNYCIGQGKSRHWRFSNEQDSAKSLLSWCLYSSDWSEHGQKDKQAKPIVSRIVKSAVEKNIKAKMELRKVRILKRVTHLTFIHVQWTSHKG